MINILLINISCVSYDVYVTYHDIYLRHHKNISHKYDKLV